MTFETLIRILIIENLNWQSLNTWQLRVTLDSIVILANFWSVRVSSSLWLWSNVWKVTSLARIALRNCSPNVFVLVSLSFGPVMCLHHSDQMSQRSLGSLCSIVKTLIVNGNGPAKGQTDKVTYTYNTSLNGDIDKCLFHLLFWNGVILKRVSEHDFFCSFPFQSKIRTYSRKKRLEQK